MDRQRVGELGDDRVQERDAHLEAVRHARAVGLGEEVVREERAGIHVLQARDRLDPERLGVARPQRRERIAAPAQHLVPQRGAERLLERVVAFERAEPGAEREPAQLEVQAQATRGARKPRDRGRQRRRDAGAGRAEPVGGVGLVAAEQLVGALAGQHRLDLTGGEPRQQPVRERRRVAGRLVVGRRDALELQRRLRAEPQLVVVGAVALGHGPGAGQLVERGDVEADAERLHRRPGQGGDQARVDPARKQHADGRVGLQVRAHGRGEPLLRLHRQRGERFAQFLAGAGTAARSARSAMPAGSAISRCPGWSLRAARKIVAGAGTAFSAR